MAPVNLLRPSCRPWTGGAISLHAVVERLRDLLPPTFEELQKARSPHPFLALLLGELSSGCSSSHIHAKIAQAVELNVVQ